MASLSDVLSQLSRDPDALASYKKDQKAFLQSAGLPSADAEVLSSGDPARIRERVLAEQPDTPTAATHWVIVVVSVSVTTAPPFEEEA
jgi:hypothetical protein